MYRHPIRETGDQLPGDGEAGYDQANTQDAVFKQNLVLNRK